MDRDTEQILRDVFAAYSLPAGILLDHPRGGEPRVIDYSGWKRLCADCKLEKDGASTHLAAQAQVARDDVLEFPGFVQAMHACVRVSWAPTPSAGGAGGLLAACLCASAASIHALARRRPHARPCAPARQAIRAVATSRYGQQEGQSVGDDALAQLVFNELQFARGAFSPRKPTVAMFPMSPARADSGSTSQSHTPRQRSAIPSPRLASRIGLPIPYQSPPPSRSGCRQERKQAQSSPGPGSSDYFVRMYALHKRQVEQTCRWADLEMAL